MGKVLDVNISWVQAGLYLGWQDVKQNYRRSALGQFWISLSTLAMVATLGLVFGQLFGVPLVEFLPYVAGGLIMWNYMLALQTDVMGAFIGSAGLIRELSISRFTFILRAWWRASITFAHNIVVFPLVIIAVGGSFSVNPTLLAVGILLLNLFSTSLGVILAFVATRYRDLNPIVSSLMLVAFYASPVFWRRESLPDSSLGSELLDFNPFSKFLSMARDPLIGVAPSGETIWFCVLAVIGLWSLAAIVYQRYKDKIVFWI